MKAREYLKKVIASTVVVGLFFFMLLVFLPAETFFANGKELPFVYGEFAYELIRYGVIFTAIIAIIISVLPKEIFRWIVALAFSIDLGVYIQTMFLNKGLDLMGQNPDGYNPSSGRIIGNLVIWCLVVIAICISVLISKDCKVLLYASTFLLTIQIVAFVSLFFKADESSFKYPDTEYHLSGEEQYTVSSEGNIILFVVDCFSDRDLNNALAVKPDAIDMLNDFVFYDNADACYFGTFPSLDHMLTNTEVDFDASVNEWTYNAWNSDKSKYFYSKMKEKDYKCNIYTPEINILCAGNSSEELLSGKWDNLSNAPLRRIVDREAIRSAMVKMAAYRMSPEVLKSRFYVGMNEYSDTVKVIDDPIMHENYDFYAKLMEQGLEVRPGKKIFMVQHIMGTHVFENDEYGNYKEDAGYEETALGCLNILKEYIEELKRLGVYDNSSIIITADHGWEYGQQPVFFVKEAYRESDEMEVTDAPISHKELLPTIAMLAGIDNSSIGETIYDYKEGQKRSRTLYFRDHMDDYPDVMYYDGSRVGESNVYVGYTYEGDEDDLLEYLFDKPSVIVSMVDSFF